jgi:N-acetylmuramoyl-L-alanine amidase
MKQVQYWRTVTLSLGITLMSNLVYAQERQLKVVYPPVNHQTTANSIFIIGSAPPAAQVLINGQKIERSSQGNFAPSFPLQMGENEFIIRYQNQEIKRTVTKQINEPDAQEIIQLSPHLLSPKVDLTRLPNELVCFEAIAPKNAQVAVKLAQTTLNLSPNPELVSLPPNSAVLIAENQPNEIAAKTWVTMEGCGNFTMTGIVEQPVFVMNYQGKTITQASLGKIAIFEPSQLPVIEVIAESGVARTGPSTNHSRLTPLPQGTRATVTGKEGEWLRLDYGGWIKASETKTLDTNVPPISNIRSVTSRELAQGVEVIFPLQNPVPISIRQNDQTLTLSLHNTIAQTDTIRFDDNPLIKRLDWYQTTPTQVDYIFHFKPQQQWGYDVRYQGSSLILTLNSGPQSLNRKNLNGIKILLDPGHGGEELGSVGPTGYPEKEVNLVVSQLLAQQLRMAGAEVYLTRERDEFVSLEERQNMIKQFQPSIALSLHYNALPDGGDALKTKGISTFWYHPQAHDLAVFLHNYLVENLNRPSYGVFWNNLALTRPHNSPTVLLELGFMINPEEFEWITNPQAQTELVEVLSKGITVWLENQT